MDETNAGHPPHEGPEAEIIEIGVEGMTCDHCARRVERALRGLSGVKEVTVDRAGGMARVTCDRSRVNVGAMHEAVRKSGYKPLATPER